MKATPSFLVSLRELGNIGKEAADMIENQRATIHTVNKINAALREEITTSRTEGEAKVEGAERQLRDKELECNRLKREIAELKSK